MLPVRYDRMIATILALPDGGESTRTMAWRQLVDLVAQAGDRLDPVVQHDAFARIATLGPQVPVAERRKAAASLAARADAQTVAIFAADAPAIAAPVLARARLADAEWLALIPRLPQPSRTILRNRRDLSPAVERALASFGPSDFALPPVEVQIEADPQSQIRNLVERIETFRRQQPALAPLATASLDIDHELDEAGTVSERLSLFSFETALDGSIDWVDDQAVDGARGAIIGTSVAEPASPRAAGVDGQAAGAFRRRAPFRDARLVIEGQGTAGGDWLITGQPLFDPRNGRFVGYRGTARRPRPEEHARRFGGEAMVPLATDSLRQLVHELRTPLNAIQGFAEMIDQQMLGPAASAYRDHARVIAEDSRRLLEVVEDIDIAARLEAQRPPLFDGQADATAVLAETIAALEPSLAMRGIVLEGRIERAVDAAVSDTQFGRLSQRLIAMVTGLAAEGETIAVTLSASGSTAVLKVARAIVLRDFSEDEMLHPDFGPEGEWPSAPLLGLGFSMRLIANLARAAQGMFSVEGDAFVVSLPRALNRDEAAGEQL
jgi:His Kinase A (phospho-acceptor) domain